MHIGDLLCVSFAQPTYQYKCEMKINSMKIICEWACNYTCACELLNIVISLLWLMRPTYKCAYRYVSVQHTTASYSRSRRRPLAVVTCFACPLLFASTIYYYNKVNISFYILICICMDGNLSRRYWNEHDRASFEIL